MYMAHFDRSVTTAAVVFVIQHPAQACELATTSFEDFFAATYVPGYGIYLFQVRNATAVPAAVAKLCRRALVSSGITLRLSGY